MVGGATMVPIQYHICMRMITINVDETVYERLRSYAGRTGRPTSELIREAMADYATEPASRAAQLPFGWEARYDAGNEGTHPCTIAGHGPLTRCRRCAAHAGRVQQSAA